MNLEERIKNISNLDDKELKRLRFEVKRKQEFHENASIVKKVLLNSSYGVSALGSNPFANGKLTGASITTSGRMSNQIVMMALNDYLAKVCDLDLAKEDLDFIIQADTDSGYVGLEKMMKLDKFKNLTDDQKITIAKKISEGKLQDVINEALDKIGKTFNLFEPEALAMENEVITRGFVSLASKRYFTRVIVNDGHILAKPKMKVVGVSLVSYSTPKFLKEKLRPVLDIVLDGSDRDLQGYIREVRDEFGKVDPMEFVRTAKVNNLGYIKKDGKYKRQKENGSWLTAPLGSTAALEHNRVSKHLKVTGRFPLIEKGDSLSYVYVRQPNYLKIAGAIGFTDPKFSREVNLKDIADYDMHWQKDFIHKIEIITKPLNWNVRRGTEVIAPW